MSFNVEEFTEYYLSHTSKETAERFGIAPSTVAGRCRKLGLPRKGFLHLNHGDINFTQLQTEVLIGSMLGDGSLSKIKTPKSLCHYEEAHSEKQIGWLAWKNNILKPFSQNITYKNKKGLKNINGKIVIDETKSFRHCKFHTMKHPFLTEMERQWYKRDEQGEYIYRITNGKKYRIKILPTFELTPLILAIWFMDDGCNDKKSKNCKFSTQSFTKNEVIILIDKIKNLGINDCHISQNKGPIIMIGTYSYLDFVNLLKSQLLDLPENMLYKLDLSEYDPATKWSDNKTGVPYFRLDGNKYCGVVMIDGQSISLGRYKEKEAAMKVSQEVEKLVRSRCKDLNEYAKFKLT